MSSARRVLHRMLGPTIDPDLLGDLDADLVDLLLPVLRLLERYFRAEVLGLEHMPAGPALMVGNHNAGITFLEPFIFGWHYYVQRGETLDINGLGHDALWHIPVLNNLLAMMGGMRANHENAARIFAAGRKVAVWPGGNYESFRPWSQRHQVDFGGHVGFVRLAFRHGVDIVPLMSLGGHEHFYVLRRGQRIARLIGAKRFLRSDAWPIFIGLPWGVGFGPIFHLPLPSKVVVEVGPPIDLSAYTPADADDDQKVQAVAEQVRATLQAMMDRQVTALEAKKKQRRG